MKNKKMKNSKLILPALLSLVMITGIACANIPFIGFGDPGSGGGGTDPTIYLRAEVMTKTMPDGRVVTGYAKDSSFGAMDGPVTVPGPIIQVTPDSTTLTIQMDNNLSVPTSLVINGQKSEMVPVRNPDGRVRSFTQETQPGNTEPVSYTFTNLRPGSYLYESGTHPAVQVQMGLYGTMVKDQAIRTAYDGVPYQVSLIALYSEIDPDLHDSVATGNYGPGQLVTSTIDFHPKYLLLNGNAVTQDGFKLDAAPDRDITILVRFMNAGINTHVPVLNGDYLNIVAEDGFPYTYPRKQYSTLLAAGKTLDSVLVLRMGSSVSLIPDRLVFHL